MNIYLNATLLCSLLLILTSCCHQKMCYNQWKEKDCYYSDYYHSPPAFVLDHNLYHSGTAR